MPVYKRQVSSISESGSAKLKGDVTLSEGSNITLTQSGQDIEIAASASGSGDVTGPASSTDLGIVTFDGTGGKTIQDSGMVISEDVAGTYTIKPNTDGIDVGVEIRSRNNGSLLLTADSDASIKANNRPIVTTTGTQTLTNKTLTSPSISTPTGLVKGDVGLGNVDNTSDATKNSASVTLTNKTLTTPVIDQFGTASGLGAAWGDWTSISYTNLTVGNGTVVAKYKQIGKTVTAHWQIICGSTTSLGNSIRMSLPVTAAARYGTASTINWVGGGMASDITGDAYPLSVVLLASTTLVNFYFFNGNAITGTFPFTEATGDTVTITLVYEAA